MKPKIAIIILAAGASNRMGVPKQLLPWGDRTLLEHSICIATPIFEDVFVVLGANAELIEQQTTLNVPILKHVNWKNGLGSSIAFAVKELKHHHFDGILFVLGDQPFVTGRYLKTLQHTFQQESQSIIASQFRKKLGVPAIFPQKYFNLLEELNADEGAKQIIKENEDNVIAIPAGDFVMDIDTKQDYKKAHKLFFGVGG
ncbi:nucleotidyltransferase family protein [Galbibacter sp. PAP.153]|uniref:nucleotidyltransferase family protein n=1 Tax=Galbibacter sp. PAP.153 TaxID=3104623 RepID=UPI00300B5E9F